MVPIKFHFEGKNIKNRQEKCKGSVPLQGKWSDAARRFGTVNSYEIEDFDVENKTVWLSSEDPSEALID